MKSIKVAALQLSSQLQDGTASISRLDYYLRPCSKNGVSIVVLGEYSLQPFFKYIEKSNLDELKKSTQNLFDELLLRANKFNLTILVPMVIFKGNKPLKAMVKFSPNGFKVKYQQILINYKHWDEENFFKNEIKNNLDFMIWSENGLKIGAMFGYEAHFDECFKYMRMRGVHVIMIPSASSFSSFERWEALLSTRAFINGVCIVRVNRIGKYEHSDKNIWDFYGHSMLINADGTVAQKLGNTEEIMISDINKSQILSCRKLWNFRLQMKGRLWA